EISACPVAQRPSRRALAASSPDTVGGRCSANVSTGAAVVGIRVEEGAQPVAADGALNAFISALAVDAQAVLIGTRFWTADVGPTAAAEATGILAARIAGCDASVLVRLVAALAEGLARVQSAGPGGPQPQGAQHRAGEHDAEPPQRFAARHGLGQRFRE